MLKISFKKKNKNSTIQVRNNIYNIKLPSDSVTLGVVHATVNEGELSVTGTSEVEYSLVAVHICKGATLQLDYRCIMTISCHIPS